MFLFKHGFNFVKVCSFKMEFQRCSNCLISVDDAVFKQSSFKK